MTVLSYDELIVNSTVYTDQEEIELEFFYAKVNENLIQVFDDETLGYSFFIEGKTYYFWRDAMASRLVVDFATKGWILDPIEGAVWLRKDDDTDIERYGIQVTFTLEA